MRIGILGGTFDPVHRGHLHLAREAKKKLRLDRILFIPAYLAPNKVRVRKEITPAGIRYEMVRRAISGFPSYKLLDIEIRKKRKVHTIETLRALKRMCPGRHEFFLLTGGDNLSILKTWKDVKGIKRLAHFVIARRPGYRKTKVPKGIVWLSIPPLAISASGIRNCAREGKRIGSWVPREVETFIRKNKLYQGAEA